MDSWIKRKKDRTRLFVQVAFAAVSNGYAQGFLKGNIFKGPYKGVCLPGLNCYSCPGALGACPIGSLQAVLGSRSYRVSFYILGFFMIVGAVLGRFVCGWLCPFGLVQDLLYKIPFFNKRKRLPFDAVLKYLKYVILLVFVILLPLFAVDIVGQGKPWFCKVICPSGTLFGALPLLGANESLRAAAGRLFLWKGFILAAVIVLSVMFYRPFCRYLCPLGAVYGFFNPISLYRYEINEAKCIRCGKCRDACGFSIKTFETPNSQECIRCGMCVGACPTDAIDVRFLSKKNGIVCPGRKKGS